MAWKIEPAVRRTRLPLKYLKPGALARLRDSRIGGAFARSHRCKADPFPLSLLEIKVPSAVGHAGGGDGYSFGSFEVRVCGGGEGPRCLTKKKLVAGRCVRLVRSEAQVSAVAVAEETVAL